MSFFERLPSSWQAGLIVIVDPFLKKMGVSLEMDKIYQELGVARMTALESARLLVNRMEVRPDGLKEERQKNKQLQEILNGKCFQTDVLIYRQQNPMSWVPGAVPGLERHQFTDEFKVFVLAKKKEYDLDWPAISFILDIPEDTLKKFKRIQNDKSPGGDDGGPPAPFTIPDNVVELLRKVFQNRNAKVTVKSFSDKHPEVLKELKLSYRELSKCLWQMGFVCPRGIFLNNTGLDRIERFQPHSVWGSDGKQMMITINGEEFRWVWQCLIDYKTTVLVGGLIGETETTDNLLEAIKISKVKTGVTPMAIVIDNRLSENLPAIRSYLGELGIEIIKTFPGNPKSSGIVEGNFNIFEKWVGGRVILNFDTAEQLSHSIAEMLTEVFTQLRNNQPRKGLSLKTANEALAEAVPLTSEEQQTIREKLKALANRLKNEQAKPIPTERKLSALAQAVEALKPPSPDVFCKRLMSSIYTAELILCALAIFKKQQEKHPEKNFEHTYFGGILRKLVDQRSVELLYTHLEQIYSDHWKRMQTALEEKNLKGETAQAACERLGQEYLSARIPAQGMLVLVHLQSMFMLASRGCRETATILRANLGQTVMKWKYDCAEKRTRLIRKLFECEAFVHQLAIST